MRTGRDEDGFPVRGTTYDPESDPQDLRYSRWARRVEVPPPLSDADRLYAARSVQNRRR